LIIPCLTLYSEAGLSRKSRGPNTRRKHAHWGDDQNRQLNPKGQGLCSPLSWSSSASFLLQESVYLGLPSVSLKCLTDVSLSGGLHHQAPLCSLLLPPSFTSLLRARVDGCQELQPSPPQWAGRKNVCLGRDSEAPVHLPEDLSSPEHSSPWLLI
jgi:hypothetical protein